MAIDFEWNGKRWEAKKVRRRAAWHEHKGVVYYDRERMRQPLVPVSHPADFEGWSTLLPSWIDPSWQAPVEPTDALANRHGAPIAETLDYILRPCHVETVCQNHEWQRGELVIIRKPATYRWELVFSDGAVFRFVSRAIAEAALSELLGIREARHPRPRYAKHSSENDAVLFTDRKLQKLPADEPTEECEAIAPEAAA